MLSIYWNSNQKEIGKDSEGIRKSKLFIDKHNWEEINYPSEKDDWIKFEKNNLTTAANVLYATKEKSKCLRFKT